MSEHYGKEISNFLSTFQNNSEPENSVVEEMTVTTTAANKLYDFQN